MKEPLPVRRYGENTGGTYYKVNEQFNVKHFNNDMMCCIDCRSNTCQHVKAVERFIGQNAFIKQVA